MKIYCIFILHTNTISVRCSLKINKILKCLYCANIKNRLTILTDKYFVSIEKI
jgi:hypothetical protein